MKKQKTIFWIWLILAVVPLFLSACGEQQKGMDGYIYNAELIPDTGNWGNNFKKSDNWLYYTGEGLSLYRIPPGELNSTKAVKLSVGEGILDYTLDEDGGIYCFRAATSWLGTGKIELSGGTLTRYQENGSKDFQISLDNRKAIYSTVSALPGFLARGSQNRVFLLSGDVVLTVDGSGKIVCEIDISAHRPGKENQGTEKLLEGGEGRVYYLAEDARSRMVYELVQEGSGYRPVAMSGNGWEGKTSITGKFYGSPEGILYSGLDGVLQRYNHQEGVWQELLRWSDSNLWRDAGEIVQISEDSILTKFSVPENGESADEFYFLNKLSADEVPDKEELILACWGSCSKELENAVIQFNRDSDQYHLSMLVYRSVEDYARLDAGLLSSEPPDMLLLAGLDVMKYGNRQVLEDLSVYLEDSDLLSRDDFLEGILEGYTVNGRLTGIPSGFMCYTLLGVTSETGGRAGWTLEEMVELTGRYPDRKLNGEGFDFNLKYVCGDFIYENLIDWESGSCRFDSGEFCDLMQWLAEYSEEGAENPVVTWTRIFGIPDYLQYVSRSGQAITSMGFPSADGEPLYQAGTQNAVGITAKSRHKEGAWQFIEYFLSQGAEEAVQVSAYMPARRDLLEKMLDEAMTPEYRTVDGEIQFDQEGKPVEIAKWVLGSPGNGRVEYGCITREEADGLMDMITHTDFSLENSLKTKVLNIIAEEMESYFIGSKTLEEVTVVIQNRVSTLVQENI